MTVHEIIAGSQKVVKTNNSKQHKKINAETSRFSVYFMSECYKKDTLNAVVAQIQAAGQTMQLSIDALKPTIDGI